MARMAIPMIAFHKVVGKLWQLQIELLKIVASFPHNSQPGSNLLRKENIPGASLNGHKPSDLHVVELKHWLKCRGATTSGRKQGLVKR